MADDELDQPVMIFGKDLRKLPCFRNSLLYGICSGLAGGLVVFMFTSKPRLACHGCVGTFSCVTLSYFVYCRRQWAYQKFSMGQIHGAVRAGIAGGEGLKEKFARNNARNNVTNNVEVVDV